MSIKKEDASVEYARLFSHTLRHIIVNWVTLRPLFRFIFSLKVVIVSLIAIASLELLDRISYLFSDPSLLESLNEIGEFNIYGFLAGLKDILLIALYLLLLHYLTLLKTRFSSEELKKLKSQGVLTNSEFMIKSLEIELSDALGQIKNLKEKGVLTRAEVDNFARLTNKRYSELCLYQKLRQAKEDKIISEDEFQQKCKTISVDVEDIDLFKSMAVIISKDINAEEKLPNV